ncbi:MAG: hypothetical protein ABS81_10285 [Pseudonocardia sp. SCN 72-86]|nr:MAG: hypothetical protein ABS81_10285 [Pseudonocardia sp. SCN 72-86]
MSVTPDVWPDTPSLLTIVRERARTTADRPFLVEVGGRTVSFAELEAEATAWAAGLHRLGVCRGDVVCSMQATSASGIALWLGACALGAIDAGIAVSYRGGLLRELLEKATVLVVDGDLLDRVTPLLPELADLRAIVLTGTASVAGDARITTAAEVLAPGSNPDLVMADPQPWDIGCLTHTSGTTGPSKGVLLPWGHLYAFATALFDPATLGPDEVFYSPMPMNHVAQRVQTYLMGLTGGRVVLRNAFSASEYWSDIRRHGATLTNVSVGARILWNAQPRPDDAENPLRRALMSPLLPEYQEFGERFGLEVQTMFGSTEVGLPIVSDGPAPYARTSGRVNSRFPHFEVRLVDEHDRPVQVGTPGELVVRTAVPWTLNRGYLGRPEASLEAWRNGWFHTGDMLVVDEDGWYSFADRVTDSIRRRGENVSSWEVERVIGTQPDVGEAAVVGVESSTWGEQDVLAVVVPTVDSSLDPTDLVRRLGEALPSFMVPRYVRVVDALPRSEATLRVQKGVLRAHGIDEDTWDREASR